MLRAIITREREREKEKHTGGAEPCVWQVAITAFAARENLQKVNQPRVHVYTKELTKESSNAILSSLVSIFCADMYRDRSVLLQDVTPVGQHVVFLETKHYTCF